MEITMNNIEFDSEYDEDDTEWLELERMFQEIEKDSELIDEMFELSEFFEFQLEISENFIDGINRVKDIFLSEKNYSVRGLLFSNLISLYEGYVNKTISNLLHTKCHERTLIQMCNTTNENDSKRIKKIKKSIKEKLDKGDSYEHIIEYLTGFTLNNHNFVAQLFGLIGIDFNTTLKTQDPTSKLTQKVLEMRNSWTHRYGYLKHNSEKQVHITDKDFCIVFLVIDRFISEIINETQSAILKACD
jgi:hypothetical protein